MKHKLAFCQDPRPVTVIDQLPLITTGKILHRELRQKAYEHLGAARDCLERELPMLAGIWHLLADSEPAFAYPPLRQLVFRWFRAASPMRC
ncbi:hypothetical protein [Rhodococcus rhodochrous]|uniref:hypothetical protein n=1 Tax=Rhodococcus rhodochrous TaxID=1829 RepID=UPI000E74D993